MTNHSNNSITGGGFYSALTGVPYQRSRVPWPAARFNYYSGHGPTRLIPGNAKHSSSDQNATPLYASNTVSTYFNFHPGEQLFTRLYRNLYKYSRLLRFLSGNRKAGDAYEASARCASTKTARAAGTDVTPPRKAGGAYVTAGLYSPKSRTYLITGSDLLLRFEFVTTNLPQDLGGWEPDLEGIARFHYTNPTPLAYRGTQND